MQYLVVLLVLVVSAHSLITDSMLEEWTEYKINYGKQYNKIEDGYRMWLYFNNKHHVSEYNKYCKTHKNCVNKFSDLLFEEFAKTHFGLKIKGFDANVTTNGSATVNARIKKNVRRTRRLPSQVDWRKHGAVTPVKDQKLCGCCWSFSATGGLEGQHFRKTGILESLSEQNLVDCSLEYGNVGCDGGLMENAFRYVSDNGIDSDANYPYEGRDRLQCRYDSNNMVLSNRGHVDIMMGSESQLQEAVATVGPVSAAVDASGWQFYKDGVYTDPQCNPNNINHAVLVVGYDTDPQGSAYWIIKNSWGTSWGIDGYIHLARNKNNMCGIATMASYPLL